MQRLDLVSSKALVSTAAKSGEKPNEISLVNVKAGASSPLARKKSGPRPQ